jgi:hypothetical protein
MSSMFDRMVTLRPVPSSSGPKGNSPITRAPARNSGTGDPGTFEMIRLCTGAMWSASPDCAYITVA